ncbi:MAG TPA: hypothetical protein VGC04_11195 [Cellulomonas sp.]
MHEPAPEQVNVSVQVTYDSKAGEVIWRAQLDVPIVDYRTAWISPTELELRTQVAKVVAW